MQVYAVKHKDEKVVAESRSGGIFTALSDIVISDGGVVYGCILDDNFNAVHVRAETFEIRNKMRGSKYVQSKIGDCFRSVKKDLDDGKIVLFSGVSCQIAGLKHFLQKDYENLLSLDILCHAVPSPKVLHKYLDYIGDVESVDFRNKKDFGWKDHVESIKTNNNVILNNKIYASMFYSMCAMRPSCYECIYKSITHPGDITIGDYWGIEKAAPEFNDNKGVSLVLINNTKGSNLFEKTKSNIIWKQTRIEDSMQRVLISPYPKPKNREKFWSDFNKYDFAYIARKYGGKLTFGDKIIRKIKNMVKRILKFIGLRRD